MRYFKGAEAKVVSAFKALPLDAMKDMIDKRQAMKDKADDNYSILKASLEADVSPVDQPRYLAIKQSFYSAIDELSNSNLSPEQSARVAVALNTQLRNEMTNGFIAQAVGNKQRILEHREELRKKAKDLNLNDTEIGQFIKAGENEFIQGGGSMDPERGVFRNYEGLNPVKRTDYNKYGRDFAAAVKTGSYENVNKVMKDYGMWGMKIGNEKSFKGFSNNTELQQFLKSPESLREAYINAIISNPEHIQALRQDLELGYHRQYGKNLQEVLFNMAGNTMKDLSFLDYTTRYSEDPDGLFSWRQKQWDRSNQLEDSNKANKVGIANESLSYDQLQIVLGEFNPYDVLTKLTSGSAIDRNDKVTFGLANSLAKTMDEIKGLYKAGKISKSDALEAMHKGFESIGLESKNQWIPFSSNFGEMEDQFLSGKTPIYKLMTAYKPNNPIGSSEESAEPYKTKIGSLALYGSTHNSNNFTPSNIDLGEKPSDYGVNMLDAVSRSKRSIVTNVLTPFQQKFIDSQKGLFASGLKKGQEVIGTPSSVTINGKQYALYNVSNTDENGSVTTSKKLIELPENNTEPFNNTNTGMNNVFFPVPAGDNTIYGVNSLTNKLNATGSGEIPEQSPFLLPNQ